MSITIIVHYSCSYYQPYEGHIFSIFRLLSNLLLLSLLVSSVPIRIVGAINMVFIDDYSY